MTLRGPPLPSPRTHLQAGGGLAGLRLLLEPNNTPRLIDLDDAVPTDALLRTGDRDDVTRAGVRRQLAPGRRQEVGQGKLAGKQRIPEEGIRTTSGSVTPHGRWVI